MEEANGWVRWAHQWFAEDMNELEVAFIVRHIEEEARKDDLQCSYGEDSFHLHISDA